VIQRDCRFSLSMALPQVYECVASFTQLISSVDYRLWLAGLDDIVEDFQILFSRFG
jgi:hypothetical protein